MKSVLIENLSHAWQRLHEQEVLPPVDAQRIQITPTKDPKHGDYASNLALMLARDAQVEARELAAQIIEHLPEHPQISSAEVAGPGFINFRLSDTAKFEIIDQILEEGRNHGTHPPGSRQRVLIEYVSANPTGPLHVGHGRGAALGSCLARLLKATGHTVECEYFVNDAGRQMDILALSVWLRYLELCGEPIKFPHAGYQGDYILDIAADLHREQGDVWHRPFENLAATAPEDGPKEDGRQAYLDFFILQGRELLSEPIWLQIATTACETLLARIQRDLEHFGVVFDCWQSERALLEEGVVDRVMAQLQEAGHLYELQGAQWFRASEFGDEKDRVVRRSNGQWTYFAMDIAYHAEKLARGYGAIINIWGADHHGYEARVRAAVQALGADPARLEILLVQFASLYRGTEKIPMSTRSGQFVTLDSLLREVGRDAARFFYVMRGAEQHLNFDLALAVEQSADNPVYYAQYAHARICSVLERLKQQGGTPPTTPCDLSPLTHASEHALQKRLSSYQEVLLSAAQEREPHQLTVYLRSLAKEFHAFYNAVTVLDDDTSVRCARLRLALAVRQVLANGLDLLGLEAPESM